MRKPILTLLLLILSLPMASAVAKEESLALQKGREVVQLLNDALRGRLMAALKESGPSGAISVCAVDAQVLTQKLGREKGVQVKRTSLKVRNPQNAPDAYEKGLLLHLSTLAQEGKLPEETIEEGWQEGKKVFRYAKPIKVAPPCLTCHGDLEKIPVEARQVIQQNYPEDQAVGYQAGDFRGIISVTIPSE